MSILHSILLDKIDSSVSHSETFSSVDNICSRQQKQQRDFNFIRDILNKSLSKLRKYSHHKQIQQSI